MRIAYADPPYHQDVPPPRAHCPCCTAIVEVIVGRLLTLEGPRELHRLADHPDCPGPNYSPVPPDDGICRDCYEWRLDGGSTWFGYRWFKKCGQNECDHGHHFDELWLA